MAGEANRVPPLSAAVLAGGRSRRMGDDKALIRLAPDLPPLAAVVIDRLRAVADDVVLVGPDRPGYGDFGVPVVADRFPGRGPLGGVATALHSVKHPHCLIVGCDMPFLNPALLRWMAMQTRDYELLLPCLSNNGRVRCHPLHAIYASSCLPAIERRLGRGRLDLHGLADEVRTRLVHAEDIAAIDPSFASFANINTPDDLTVARDRLRQSGRRELQS